LLLLLFIVVLVGTLCCGCNIVAVITWYGIL
jgi:hypothetical protein